MNEAANWFEFARTDLKMAELALAAGLFNQACFHAHQAVEKLLKGFILARGKRVPRTHSLVDLGRLAQELGFPKELRDKIRILDGYYLPTRYPDAIPDLSHLPNRDEAQEAISLAKEAWQWITGREDEPGKAVD
jgi:HEPN domain-containing protein